MEFLFHHPWQSILYFCPSLERSFSVVAVLSACLLSSGSLLKDTFSLASWCTVVIPGGLQALDKPGEFTETLCQCKKIKKCLETQLSAKALLGFYPMFISMLRSTWFINKLAFLQAEDLLIFLQASSACPGSALELSCMKWHWAVCRAFLATANC